MPANQMIKKFLQLAAPQTSKPRSVEKTSAKVLKSTECRKAMEEKERLKREKQEETKKGET